MNNKKSSIFNIDASLFSAFIWIVSMLMFNSAKSIPTMIITFLILKFERNSQLVRNHAGQALIASIATMIVSFAFNFITTFFVILLAWIPIIGATTYALTSIVRLALQLLVLAYLALGLLKAIQSKRLSLPIIGHWGDQLTDSIHP